MIIITMTVIIIVIIVTMIIMTLMIIIITISINMFEMIQKQEAMRSRQIAERLGVEEAHMMEFQQFNFIWDRKMSEYELHAGELVEVVLTDTN